MNTDRIEIRELSTGFYHAQGNGPCEFAQWPKGNLPAPNDFFPEASDKFRKALMNAMIWGENQDGSKEPKS